MDDLTARRVMVTAAADGIGLVIAQAFAMRGASVHICDADAEALAKLKITLPAVIATVVDLADADATRAWCATSIASLGGVDVLINNAGVKGPTALVEDVDPDDWRYCLAVCLDSHFLCARAVAPLMKAQRAGSIINISSVAGLVGYGMRTPYAAAKWAVIGLTKSLAIELGPHNVRCNAICPGSVAGARIDRVIVAEAEQRGVAAEVIAAEYTDGQSIKRFVEANEVADLCLFLASPAATMITGQAIAVDGHTETYHLG